MFKTVVTGSLEAPPAATMGPGLGRRATSGAAWIALEMVAVQGTSLLVFAAMARFLSPVDFGLASICFGLVHSCKNVLFDNVSTIVARKIAGTDAEYSTAFWITIATAAAAFAGLQAFSLAADSLFHAAGLGQVLRAMSLMLLVQGIARTQEVWLVRHFHYRMLAIRAIVGAIVGGAAGVAAAALGLGVWALVIQQVATLGIAFALLWSNCPWRPGLRFSRATAREILAFSWSMSGGNLAYAFNQNCDTILIGLVFGPASVGLYSVAKRLRLALQLVAATPISGVILPVLAEVQRDPMRFGRVLLTVTATVAAVCGPLFIGSASIAQDAITLVFGSKWAAAAPIFAWLAVAGLLNMLIDVNNTVFVIRNRPEWTLYLALLTIGTTALLFSLMRSDQPGLVALPFALPYLLIAPVSIGLLLHLTGLTPRQWATRVLPPLTAAGVMALLLWLLKPAIADLPLLPRTAVSIGAGATVYAAALLLVSRDLVVEAVGLLRGLPAGAAAVQDARVEPPSSR